ncbi:PucR family transcriptional regulator [Microbacterium keratanolyticum]|uniref:PucR family transcriptional regulator n=1 Tax=Microbacterium keratanolyticum TaxID=67574 RepID=UPI0036352475
MSAARIRQQTVGDGAARLSLVPVLMSAPSASRVFTRTMLHEDGELANAQDALILGVGVRTAEDVADAAREAVRAGAAALVVREPVPLDDETRALAEQGALAILGAPIGVDWLRLASYLAEEPTTARYGIDDDGDAAAASDLFDLANSLSSVLGGPVTIENNAHRILAFSADQAKGDEARKHSVLGHQVPQYYTEILARSGALRRIDSSATPVFLGSIGEGILPRVAMRVRAGGESLGSIWAIVDDELTPLQTGALTEAAAVASITLFRQRASSDAARRLRANEVLDLLAGGVQAREAAERLGYGSAPTSILAAAPAGRSGSPSDEAANLQRLADALGLYLHQLHPLSVAAPVGGTVYAVLPHLQEHPSADFARQVALTFSERFRHGRAVVVGVGGPAAQVTELQHARAAADRALRVLAHSYRDAQSRRVATDDEVQIESLLLRLSDQLTADGVSATGPLVDLRAHDAAHGTEYVATLAAWLDAFGDVGVAAETLHVHPNTFRYRLRKLNAIVGTELYDPQRRFGLMLQLRLFGMI